MTKQMSKWLFFNKCFLHPNTGCFFHISEDQDESGKSVWHLAFSTAHKDVMAETFATEEAAQLRMDEIMENIWAIGDYAERTGV